MDFTIMILMLRQCGAFADEGMTTITPVKLLDRGHRDAGVCRWRCVGYDLKNIFTWEC